MGRDWRRLLSHGLAGIAALLLAAPYLVPALTLQPHISASVLWSPFYQPESWSWLAGPASPVRPAVISWPLPIAGASVILAAGAGWYGRKNGRPEAMVWAGICLASAVMGLALIPGVWRLPVLYQVQFPWRLFAVMEFAAVAAVAAAGRLPNLPSKVAGVAAVAAYTRMAMLVVLTATSYVLPSDLPRRLTDAPEYLPAGFDVSRIDEWQREPDLRALRGPAAQGPVAEVRPGPDGRLELQVTAPGPVLVRRLAFPSWQVEHAGRPAPTTATTPHRLIAFDAPAPGAYVVRRRTLPAETAGVAGFLIGLILLAALMVVGARQECAVRRRDTSPQSE